MANIVHIEDRLWDTANHLWANSGLKPSEFAGPVLGLIFLKYADGKFTAVEKQLEKKGSSARRKIGKTSYKAAGCLYLPEIARFQYLLHLPEGAKVAKAVNEAMQAVEEENPDLAGILPRNYQRLESDLLTDLLKTINAIPGELDGDAFGRIYEYFLGKFAMKEGQKGGEFFTPTCLVRLIVEIIEPFHGRIYDPACGSGGMFCQSAGFIAAHQKNPASELAIYGQEKTRATVHLCKMNLAVHGLEGDIREANTFYDDLHRSIGKFDFCMANPPFNMKRVDKAKLKTDGRFPFGLPNTDNANYLWIQMFYSALSDKGRSGFVMANSAADARSSEQLIRKQIIEDKCVDVMIAIGPNFFYTVTLPCTLWFFDKGKTKTKRADQVLFIDAREIFHQIDRAHREFQPEHIEFIANIVRLYRSEKLETVWGSKGRIKETFGKTAKYQDIPGLCKVATLEQIREQDYSLNPGRYVGVAVKDEDDGDFFEEFGKLNAEFMNLTKDAHKLEKQIAANVKKLLEGE